MKFNLLGSAARSSSIYQLTRAYFVSMSSHFTMQCFEYSIPTILTIIQYSLNFAGIRTVQCLCGPMSIVFSLYATIPMLTTWNKSLFLVCCNIAGGVEALNTGGSKAQPEYYIPYDMEKIRQQKKWRYPTSAPQPTTPKPSVRFAPSPKPHRPWDNKQDRIRHSYNHQVSQNGPANDVLTAKLTW